MIAIPDTDDRVLVLLPHGDPAAAIVVGGLYGDALVDPGIEGGAVRRWSGADAGRPAGLPRRRREPGDRGQLRRSSAVVLAPDKVTVHAKCDLTIEAPGRTLQLRANKIELGLGHGAGGSGRWPRSRR